MSAGERLDALILGGGVAGITAALWLRGFALTSLILEESPQPGGQLREIHAPIHDYPLAYGLDGARLAERILNDARRAELSILAGSPVTRVSVAARSATRGTGASGADGRGPGAGGPDARGPGTGGPDARGPGTGGPDRFRARALLIATGLERRALGVPGERELAGRGVSHSANRDRDRYAGRPVVVVGGGTAAVEDALLCAEVGCAVTLLHRSARFRARSDFLARARREPGIRIVPNAQVTRILGEERVEEVYYQTKGSGITRFLRAEAVFVRIGWDPRTELVRGQLRLDRAGYMRVKPGGETSEPGVFAAGDVCSPRWPSIANAAGQGAAAAWTIARYLGRVRG